MANIRNLGIAVGRLTKDVYVAPTNKDGSRKVKVSLAVQDNFKGKDGERGVQFIELEAFIPADKKNLGPYDYMKKGDMVGFEYTVRTNNYEKDGVMHYGQILFIQSVDLMQPKKAEEANAEAPAKEADFVEIEEEMLPF